MDTPYKNALCSKLDMVSKYERNGYGLVRTERPFTPAEYATETAKALVGVLAVVAFAGALVLFTI